MDLLLSPLIAFRPNRIEGVRESVWSIYTSFSYAICLTWIKFTILAVIWIKLQTTTIHDMVASNASLNMMLMSQCTFKSVWECGVSHLQFDFVTEAKSHTHTTLSYIYIYISRWCHHITWYCMHNINLSLLIKV